MLIFIIIIIIFFYSCVGGFAGVKTVIANSKHVPFACDCDEYSSNTMTAMQTYGRFESALENLPRPTLVTCTSGARASAVVMSYIGVHEYKTFETIKSESSILDLGFLKQNGQMKWVESVLTTKNNQSASIPYIFRQLYEKESSTYTYLLADPETKEAILIDPVLETVDRDAKLIKEMGLNLKYTANTHCHADHITGTGQLKQIFPEMKSMIALASTADADIKFVDGDMIQFGNRFIHILATPGHTAGCCCFVMDDFTKVFSGDTILIRGCGRTDFQGGSSSDLYENIHNKLFTLPGNTEVYPAHDYKGNHSSTINEERNMNPRLIKTKTEFIELMSNLNLPYPKKIDASLPANLKCGIQD